MLLSPYLLPEYCFRPLQAVPSGFQLGLVFFIVLCALPLPQPLPNVLDMGAVMFLQPTESQRGPEESTTAITEGNSGLDMVPVNQLHPIRLARIATDDFEDPCCIGLRKVLPNNLQKGPFRELPSVF